MKLLATDALVEHMMPFLAELDLRTTEGRRSFMVGTDVLRDLGLLPDRCRCCPNCGRET